MNKVFRIAILTLLALATVATTIQFADAGELYWRKHGHRWHRPAVVIGIAPRVVVAHPRVIYRDAPVVIHEGPVYDRETIYNDDDTVYADPEEDYGDRVYRNEAPDADEYAAPRYRNDDDDQSYDGDRSAGTDDDYFPDRPQARLEQKQTIAKQKTVVRQEAQVTSLKPWTKEWRDWCSDRFSTFNPQNGTYLGYDQKRHFCKAG